MEWWEYTGLLASVILAFFVSWAATSAYRSVLLTRQGLGRIKQALAASTPLRPRMQHIVNELAKLVPVQSIVMLAYQDDSRYTTVGTPNAPRPSRSDCLALDDFFASCTSPLLSTHSLERSHAVRRMLIGYKTDVVVPLRRTGQPIGYLFLHSRARKPFSRRDLRLLEQLSDDIAMATENAVLLQAKHDLSEHLQQKIESATTKLRTSNVQLRQLDEAKDEFLSMASHQLRTPLTSVKGYISMVLEGDAGRITKLQEQLLGEAFTSSERMVRLINDFLNVSRIQTGKFAIERREVDLVRIIQQEVEALETTATSRGLTIKVDLPKKPVRMSVDEGKMRQVIMNFIDNAVYYSPEGTRIDVELKPTSSNVIFRVHDSGIGVPVDQQAQLFTKFFRANNARKQRPDGTGVGLFLAKKIIDGHKGVIVFSSKEGQGSTFGFRLPK